MAQLVRDLTTTPRIVTGPDSVLGKVSAAPGNT